MNIDFKKFKVYDTLDKTTPIILDISKELANGLYKTAQGIDGHALALKYIILQVRKIIMIQKQS